MTWSPEAWRAKWLGTITAVTCLSLGCAIVIHEVFLGGGRWDFAVLGSLLATGSPLPFKIGGKP